MDGIIVKAVLALIVLFIIPTPPAIAVENPTHPENFKLSARQKAEFFLVRKQYEEALQAYKSLLKEESEDSALFRGLVKSYAGAEKLREAENFIKDFISAHPESSAGQYGSGYFHSHQWV